MRTILCFGDSNTNGCNPKCDIRDWKKLGEQPPVRYSREIRWTGILQKLLGEDYYVIEEGLPGRTFMYEDAILPDRAGKDMIRPCMWSHNPVDLLVVMLGTNDAKTLYGSKEYILATEVEEFLKIAKDPAVWDPNIKPNILLIAPPPMGDDIQTSPYYGMFDEKSVELSKKFSSLYKDIAEVNKCHYFDASLYTKSDSGDSIHFSPEGHKQLAEGLAKKIREIFE